MRVSAKGGGEDTINGHQPADTSASQMEDGLPFEDYDSFSATQIVRKLPQLSATQVERLYRYEKARKKRRRLLRHLEDRIGSAAATVTAGREDPPPGEERPEKSARARMGKSAREDPPPGEERPERRVT